MVDSPIVIRTADVDLDGRLTVTAGATLVRDSDAGVRGRRDARQGRRHPQRVRPGARGPGARRSTSPSWSATRTCCSPSTPRNRRLSQFWLDRPGRRAARPAAGRQARGDPRRRGRLREHAAPRARRARHDHRGGAPRGLRARLPRRADLVIVGPGPGDPRDDDDPKMAKLRPRSPCCWPSAAPFLAVCLGHQALCHELGIPLAYKDIVFQGTQSPVAVDGRTERVGFYNTFVGRVGAETALPDGVTRRRRRPTGDVHHLRRPALPRHPVPRRVDPHRARLRPPPRPGGRPPARLTADPAAWRAVANGRR